MALSAETGWHTYKDRFGDDVKDAKGKPVKYLVLRNSRFGHTKDFNDDGFELQAKPIRARLGRKKILAAVQAVDEDGAPVWHVDSKCDPVADGPYPDSKKIAIPVASDKTAAAMEKAKAQAVRVRKEAKYFANKRAADLASDDQPAEKPKAEAKPKPPKAEAKPKKTDK